MHWENKKFSWLTLLRHLLYLGVWYQTCNNAEAYCIAIQWHTIPLPLQRKECSTDTCCHVGEPRKHAKEKRSWISLIAQWVRICLPMQGTRVQSCFPGRSHTLRGPTEPSSHSSWASVLQLLQPACCEPAPVSARSPCNEKPKHCNQEQAPLATTREKPD